MSRFAVICMLILFGNLTADVSAEFIEYSSQQEWEEAVNNSFTTLDFVLDETNQFLTDQYADQGVLFPDGNDLTISSDNFLNDGWGLRGSLFSCGLLDMNCEIEVVFDTPQQWVAIDNHNGPEFLLFMDDTLLYNSVADGFGFPDSGPGSFAGIVTDQQFNRALIFQQGMSGTVMIDDLLFGSSIPTPATLLPLLYCLAFRSRGRSAT